MKKWMALLLAIVLVMGLSACGGDPQSSTDTIASYVETAAGKLALGDSFDAEVYGSAQNVEEAPSCHYEGMDTIYTYEHLTVYTYMLEGRLVVYSIELQDDSLKTPEGAFVGMTEEAVRDMYGEPDTTRVAGIYYTLWEKAHLGFLLKDGVVTRIEYYEE